MVIIGHSQGGLLTKLTATQPATGSGGRSATNPWRNFPCTEEQRARLRRLLFLEPLPFVSRVIFISTPHRGSYLASSFARRLAGKLMSLPSATVQATRDAVSSLKGDQRRAVLGGRLPTSLDSMSPKNPGLLALADIPVAPTIKAHSIIPVQGEGICSKAVMAWWPTRARTWTTSSRNWSCAVNIPARTCRPRSRKCGAFCTSIWNIAIPRSRNMKHKITRFVVLATLVALTSCSSTSTPPPPAGSANITYTKGVPGGKLVQTVKVTATVTAIDQAERKATLQKADGKQFTVEVAPGAVNLDQIRVGDRINATVTQKVDISLDNNEPPSAKGVRMTAKVIAIDAGNRTVTLRFEDGSTETQPVRDDVNLSRHKVGEQVVFRVTEMTAIWVEKAQ